jgi:hypothetical protein
MPRLRAQDLDDERRFALNSKARSLLGCDAVYRLSVMTPEIDAHANVPRHVAVHRLDVIQRGGAPTANADTHARDRPIGQATAKVAILSASLAIETHLDGKMRIRVRATLKPSPHCDVVLR